MIWKGIDFFPHDIKIPFMSWKRGLVGMSIVLNILALVLLWKPGLNLSIDFTGGTLLELQSKLGPADIPALRSQLNRVVHGDVQVQGFGGPNEVLIRIPSQPGGDKAQQAALVKVRDAIGAAYEVRRTETVGPAVSGELARTGIIAVLTAILGIAIYVWFRFEWQFALGGIVALLHDVLLTVGALVILQMDFDISCIAALLLIIGYSINDTVVVYDRIRENLRKFKKMPIEQLIDLSVNETLSRTILTSGTTVLALLALYVFGSEVIKSFSFAMLFGVLAGTYSSIFIAAPVLVYFGVKREWGSGIQGSKGGKEKAQA
jgi:preprotein translocase subunit SecF/SecD/SecF fusion protein